MGDFWLLHLIISSHVFCIDGMKLQINWKFTTWPPQHNLYLFDPILAVIECVIDGLINSCFLCYNWNQDRWI